MPTVCLSTTEAELAATTYVAMSISFLRRLLQDPSYSQPPTPLYIDSQSALTITASDALAVRRNSRHVAVRWFYCRSLQHAGLIEPLPIAGGVNPADVMTKQPPIIRFVTLGAAIVVQL